LSQTIILIIFSAGKRDYWNSLWSCGRFAALITVRANENLWCECRIYRAMAQDEINDPKSGSVRSAIALTVLSANPHDSHGEGDANDRLSAPRQPRLCNPDLA
jgi:hypothetical protein